MVCYKDMTFCNADCSNDDCYRQLTEKVRKDAEKWWGSDDAPIAVSDFSSRCKEFIPLESLTDNYKEPM